MESNDLLYKRQNDLLQLIGMCGHPTAVEFPLHLIDLESNSNVGKNSLADSNF